MCFINLQISTCICTLNKRPCNQSYWAKLSQTTQPCLTVFSQLQFNNRTRFCLFIYCFSTLFDVIYHFTQEMQIQLLPTYWYPYNSLKTLFLLSLFPLLIIVLTLINVFSVSWYYVEKIDVDHSIMIMIMIII